MDTMRYRPLRLWTLLASLLALAAATAGAEDLRDWRQGRTQVRLPVVRPAELGPPADAAALRERAEILAERNHRIHAMLGPRHLSQRSLRELARRGLGPARSLDAAAKDAGTDTLRVLIVRIGFETDRSGDLTSVTTDGDFQLEPDPSVRIDPPPHNRDFYMAHLYGLSEYYRIQSGGRLQIQGRVLPEGQNDCYRLSDIADYAPGEGGFWDVPMLERLVRDMLTAADEGTQADGDVSLADFDDDDPLTYVILVHAGADWQTDINRDSPNDIPTFFVTLGEPQALTSVDTETGEAGAISECSIIPETTSQDGFLGSIAGALYHEFGHALGLPDVYDTTTGLPAVGLWDLMDSGPNLIAAIGFQHPTIPDSVEVEQVSGVLPPSLSAWCRWYLGWLDPQVLDGAEREVRLPAVQVPRSDYAQWYSGSSVDGDPYDFDTGYPQVVLAGASPREFVLLENRWVPWAAGELPDQTGIGFVSDDETGVLLYMGGDPLRPSGVYRNTGMYDFFMPSGGLLAWHVNQDRILQGMPDNTINGDGDGLRLIEADGIQDVGVYEAYVLGFYGSETDAFHAANADRLARDGRPSTRAYDRSWTGAELRDLSANTATMSFTGAVYPLAPGSPWRLPAPATVLAPRRLDPESLTPFTLDGKPVLVAASLPVDGAGPGEGAKLYAWDPDGTSAVLDESGVALDLDAPLAGPPLVVEGGARLILATRDGWIHSLPPVSEMGVWTPEWSTQVGDSLAFAPMLEPGLTGDVLRCPVHPAQLVTLTLTGERVGLPTDISLDEAVAAPFVPAGNFYAVLLESAWGVMGAPTASGGPITEHPDAQGAFGGVSLRTADGARTVLLDRSGHGTVVDVTAAGVAATQAWDAGTDGAELRALAAADLDADGADDLIVVTATSILAYGPTLAPLTGWPVHLLDQFPLDADTEFSGGLAVFDGDGDGVNEVWAASDGGHVIGFDARGVRLDHTPLLWADRGAARCVVGDAGELGRVLWLVDPGGREHVTLGGGEATGLSRTAVDGGVAGYLTPAAAGKAGGTSEWLGPLGGPARRGPVGEAQAVAGAPAEAERERFLIYPNPAREQRAAFRFWAEAAGTARVTVFNLEGEIVASLARDVPAGLVSEIVWPLGDLASGVYVCRLDAPAIDGRVTRLERLAVER